MRRQITFLTVLLAFIALFSLTGCIFSPDDDTGPPPGNEPPEYDFPDTKEIVLGNLKIAYEEMDINGYRDCLHPDFKFVFTDFDADQFEIPNSYFERSEDLEVMERTFSGNSHTTEDGTQPGLQDISISDWTNGGVWQQEAANHIYFPEAYRALYNIYMVYSEVGGEHTFTIQTTQHFYVEPVEELQDDGTTRTHWYIIGQEDLLQ
ncbi:hypothetical protein HN388_07325 [bacterium]|jgi:hypothetical protein|nr:hypothetical protein [bacterium]MBT4291401.1 hypothetical protein [bacterium]